MIQRIQTVYLLLAAIAMGATWFFPLASVYGTADSIMLYSYKVVSLVPDNIPAFSPYFMMPLQAISGLTFVLAIIAIFLFKNRRRQINMVRTAIIFLIVMIGLFFFYYEKELAAVAQGQVGYETGAYLPVVAFVFYVLAYRGIMNDEKLIRSANRLR